MKKFFTMLGLMMLIFTLGSCNKKEDKPVEVEKIVYIYLDVPKESETTYEMTSSISENIIVSYSVDKPTNVLTITIRGDFPQITTVKEDGSISTTTSFSFNCFKIELPEHIVNSQTALNMVFNSITSGLRTYYFFNQEALNNLTNN